MKLPVKKVIAEVSIIPIGTGSTSLSHFVANCHGVLKGYKDINYQLTPMGTIIEGDLNSVIRAILKMHEAPFKQGALRVVTTIKLDDRRDKVASMKRKVNSVIKKLK